MMTKNVNLAPKASIPKAVVITSFYRDESNWKNTEHYFFSNVSNMDSSEIMEALRSINSDLLVPAEYGLPTNAPLRHPDEKPSGIDDNCYIEFDADEHISFREKPISSMGAEGDIAEIIANIKEVKENGSIQSYRELTESIHTERVIHAQNLSLSI
ncbi:hypothetical protein [Alteromonas sp. 14N.309.X.WAT.G.H12]|uniref:hypothetical protein n=1 Tax=Alteromonas sp. 14N.309.X.WAT.G.H12 TaxID=3120824 RepID=UPI002FD50A20